MNSFSSTCQMESKSASYRKMKKQLMIILSVATALLIGAVIILPDMNISGIKSVMVQYPGIDKPVHFLEHIFIFIVIYAVAKPLIGKPSKLLALVAATVMSILISFGDEFHQTFISGRSFEIDDLIANTLGLLAGLIIVNLKKANIKVAGLSLVVITVCVGYLTNKSYNKLKHYYAGMSYEKNKEYSKAREQYALSLIKEGKNASVHNSIAWVDLEFLNGDPQIASEHARVAVSMDPENPDYLDTYGWSLLRVNKPAEALKFIKKAFDLDPSIFCINYHLGMTYNSLGKVKRALHYFKMQIEQNSKNKYAGLSRKAIDKIEGRGKISSELIPVPN